VYDPIYPLLTWVPSSRLIGSMYGDVKEMILSDAPVPFGKEVDLRLFVDSDHAGESSQGVQGLGLLST
jgi:hypothetical protein